MAETADTYVMRAKIAEQAERYEDMAKVLGVSGTAGRVE